MRLRIGVIVLLMAWVGGDALLAQANFATSLHSTRQGKFNAYAKENGGMELITNIPMEDLACWQCHGATDASGNAYPENYVPGCGDCHGAGFAVAEQSCLACHTRQTIERTRYGAFEGDKVDVHMNAGMQCWACHSAAELHGDDGVLYPSLKAAGAVQVSCVQCHNNVPVNEAHALHADTVDCSACHAVGTVTCAGCHFETVVATGKNRAINQLWNFKMLVKKDGKVKLGSFLTHSFDGKTNVIISSFHSHTIKKEASSCQDCHANFGGANAAIQQYNNTGGIQMTEWVPNDAGSGTIRGPQGVVPIPADWQTALKYDFVTYDGDPSNLQVNTPWSYLKSTVDNQHLFYAEPLDRETMRKLGFNVAHLEPEFSDVFYFPLFGDGAQFQSSLLLASVAGTQDVKVEFFDRAGAPMAVTLGEDGPAASFDLVFTPGRVYSAQSPGGGDLLQVGYAVVKVKPAAAQVMSRGVRLQATPAQSGTPAIAGTVVFSRTEGGIGMTEAGIPGSRPIQDFTVILDSRDARDTGLAMVNPAAEVVDLTVSVWDKEFTELLGQVVMSIQPGEAIGKFIHEIFSEGGASAELVTQLQEIEAVVTVGASAPVAALTLRQNDDLTVPFPDEVPILTAFPVIPGRADQN